jgi:ribosomal protein S18 acetylase RimI-like enzyme
MQIERVRTVTPELLEAFARLVPQLTDNNPPPDAADLQALLASDTNVLVVARAPAAAGGRIVGSGSLGVYRVPTGVRAVIEDVVVEDSARGGGIGERIMLELMGAAKALGASGVSLTSNPKRAAANRLYVRMGFALRHTNCYYFKFGRGT